jgi:hypothetical protein
MNFTQVVRRQLTSSEHLLLRLPHGATLRRVFVLERFVRNEIFGAIVLELDRIGAGVGGSIDCAMSQVHVPVMVDPNFGGNETGLTITDYTIANSY